MDIAREPTGPSALDVAAEPWVFTQSHPLDVGDFARVAEQRGLALDWQTLAALHRRRVLSPMLEVHETRIGAVVAADPTRPPLMGTYATEFVTAWTDGRLSDPAATALSRGWRFDIRRHDDPSRWWNGLLYSRWQVLQLVGLGDYLRRGYRLGQARVVVLPRPGTLLEAAARRSRALALTVTAVEARYFPQIRPNVLSFVNTDETEWRAYCDTFDAMDVADRLGVTAQQLRNEAERLLTTAHSIDPLGNWYHVIKHAPPKHWDDLSGAARLAMDLRMGAELLIMFSEDLSGSPIPPATGQWWSPLHERLTRRVEPLESALANHGVAPGARVVVIVEGESELLLARHICEQMGIDPAALHLRVICARGAGGLGVGRGGLKPISRLAAHLLTPVIADRLGDSYTTLEPLCGVIVAVDPDDVPEPPSTLSARLVDEVERNLLDQSIDDVDRGALEHQLIVHTWPAEFEFAHFTDDEIADALARVDPNLGGNDRATVLTSLARCRQKRLNIKQAWRDWKKTPSKATLAEALWPTLKAQIDTARRDDRDLPELAGLLWFARSWAIGQSLANYVLPTKTRGEGGM